VFHISDVHTAVFKAAVAFGDITVRRGFISALVRVNNRLVRIADTHLDNKYPGDAEEASIAIQQAQAAELLKFFRNSPQPVIIAGDFNSDAIAGSEGSGPDNTDTAKNIVLAGYDDSWAAAHPTEPGPTWPLFLEDQNPPPPFFIAFTPIERIDLIFSKGLEVMSSAQIGAGLTYPAAASDHVGVVSAFEIPR
jgi:endonuclease/exonuclease/phosphatase family metal-dependent hydrolase